MKLVHLLTTLLLPLWLIAPLQASPLPLSLAFDDAPVAQILQALADYQQLNLLVAPGVEGRLSLRLKEVGWQQALSLVSRLAKLSVNQEGNVLLVFPQSWQEEKQRQRAQEREEAEKALPLSTLALTLRHAEAEQVNASLLSSQARLLTARGSVTVDKRTNSLILRDTQAALEEIQRWVAALDTPLEQVELAAHIVTISEESLHELGVNWGMGGDEQINKALRVSQLRVDLPATSPTMTFGFALARLDGRVLDLALSALEQENKLEIIASPRLFTSHQQPASIKQGTEIPYEVASGSNGSTSVEFREAMLGMEVTPYVQPNGRIMLKLHISQNLPGSTVRSGEGEYIAIDKQEIQTQVTLKDGQTLALGGIFQQQRTQGRNQVPLLGNIPLLGTLFRHQTTSQKKRELVIFITPKLIRDE
ncbi:DNA uptake porin HofQ [Kalamiella sp. sgz302252]|uniref:DNA uptake porin HofQ n=1 Tax=Pantoea sp. sgz302252 TaxID=3341827 RepID=UPI0036D412E3